MERRAPLHRAAASEVPGHICSGLELRQDLRALQLYRLQSPSIESQRCEARSVKAPPRVSQCFPDILDLEVGISV